MVEATKALGKGLSSILTKVPTVKSASEHKSIFCGQLEDLDFKNNKKKTTRALRAIYNICFAIHKKTRPLFQIPPVILCNMDNKETLKI